ncbi:MAG: ATP-binding protein [Candidatus Aenigmarchaeota archaeon]|nr:ATP-binding protein [Candidatus Aenigmarchaeota archaeon]
MLSETDMKVLEKLKGEIAKTTSDMKKTARNSISNDKLVYIGVRLKREHIKMLKKRTKKISVYIREIVEEHLSKTISENILKPGENSRLYKFCFNYSDDKPVQVVGNSGIGKTTLIKQMIANDPNHIYIVFDAHNEYQNLQDIQTITDDLTQSCKIKMPEQIAASKGLFQVYFNQILSKKWPNNYVIVIEEAHRYREIKELLKEARKFVKLIVITQEALGDFTPIVRVKF